MILIGVLALLQDPGPDESVLGKLRAAYNDQKFQAIQALFNPAMAQALPPEKTEEFFSRLRDQSGRWTASGPPKRSGPTAVLTAKFERASWEVVLTLDDQGRIAGLLFRPPRTPAPVPPRNSVPLALPFRDEWFVFWGGDTKAQNYHVVEESQRRAFDLLAVDEKGLSHRGEGTRNEDYYAWGREILSPADGLVVEAIDGVRDNEPGKMNPFSAVGNAVLIEHAPHEVSVLAHLQRGSVRVKAGHRVKRGEVLGLCGNSGNSSEPHLHFHLMNGSLMQEATGFKAYFDRLTLTRDGKLEERLDYSPVKGDRLTPR
jgi:murein DD-endopeptidase MepM/ murein hydrolase activator NlpD